MMSSDKGRTDGVVNRSSLISPMKNWQPAKAARKVGLI